MTEEIVMKELMKLASFPEDAREEMILLRQRFEENGYLETLLEEVKMLVELPAETHLLGKHLKEISEKWGQLLQVSAYSVSLLILLECWVIVKEKYQEAGLSEVIFKRTLHDLNCKLMECREVYGINGIFVGHWYDRFFDLTRFALGRLQFELIPYEFDIPVETQGRTLKKGDWVINMHIPSEGPLDLQLVEESLEQAREFFVKNAGQLKVPEKFERQDGFSYPGTMDTPVVFVMDSWLLDPDLRALLPEGNLKEFTNRFDVIYVKKEERFEDGWRVFGKEWEKDPSELPVRTRLQKAIAEYLKTNGKLGEGFGILVR